MPNKIRSIIKRNREPILLALINVVFVALAVGWFYSIYHISAIKGGEYPGMSYELIEENLRIYRPIIIRNAITYGIVIFLVLLFPSLQWRFWQIKQINLLKLVRKEISERRHQKKR